MSMRVSAGPPMPSSESNFAPLRTQDQSGREAGGVSCAANRQFGRSALISFHTLLAWSYPGIPALYLHTLKLDDVQFMLESIHCNKPSRASLSLKGIIAALLLNCIKRTGISAINAAVYCKALHYLAQLSCDTPVHCALYVRQPFTKYHLDQLYFSHTQ